MTSESSKRRDFLALVFISKSISKKLLIIIIIIIIILIIVVVVVVTFKSDQPLWQSLSA